MNLNKVPVKYRKDIKTAARFLKKEGCEAVYLFGSLVTGKVHNNSDIDIGITGLPEQKFLKVYAGLDGNLTNRVDLVDFDENKKLFSLLSLLGEVAKLE